MHMHVSVHAVRMDWGQKELPTLQLDVGHSCTSSGFGACCCVI
jgi:hypothetical protein